MPMPVSVTSMRQPSATGLSPRRTPPRRVYFSALSSRLRRQRSSSTGSLRVVAAEAPGGSRSHSRSPAASAAARCSSTRRCSSGGSATGCGWLCTTPASSREMSRSTSNIATSACSDWPMCATRSAAGSASASRCNEARYRASACTGWRRSWLAAARKRVLAALASASARFSSSSRARAASALRPRCSACSRCQRSRSSWCAISSASRRARALRPTSVSCTSKASRSRCRRVEPAALLVRAAQCAQQPQLLAGHLRRVGAGHRDRPARPRPPRPPLRRGPAPAARTRAVVSSAGSRCPGGAAPGSRRAAPSPRRTGAPGRHRPARRRRRSGAARARAVHARLGLLQRAHHRQRVGPARQADVGVQAVQARDHPSVKAPARSASRAPSTHRRSASSRL